MSKVSQKEAVYSAIVNVLAEENQSVSENTAIALTKEQRTQVNAILFEGLRAETIEFKKTNVSDSDLKEYCSSLQSNWTRKDKRLNGNVEYEAKNPGSRAGSGDPQLKAMRALLATLSNEDERAEVQGYIDSRLAEVQVSKAKTVTIDFSVLPADLARFAK